MGFGSRGVTPSRLPRGERWPERSSRGGVRGGAVGVRPSRSAGPDSGPHPRRASTSCANSNQLTAPWLVTCQMPAGRSSTKRAQHDREIRREGGVAALVGDEAERVVLRRQAQHGLDHVRAVAAAHPGRADDRAIVVDRGFAGELRLAVHRLRVRRVASRRTAQAWCRRTRSRSTRIRRTRPRPAPRP